MSANFSLAYPTPMTGQPRHGMRRAFTLSPASTTALLLQRRLLTTGVPSRELSGLQRLAGNRAIVDRFAETAVQRKIGEGQKPGTRVVHVVSGTEYEIVSGGVDEQWGGSLYTLTPVQGGADVRVGAENAQYEVEPHKIIAQVNVAPVSGDVAKLADPELLKRRAQRLVADPGRIDQGAFGVCGLVSILRYVLLSNPVRFATLTRAALGNRAHLEEWLRVFGKEAQQKHINNHCQLEFVVAQWLLRHHGGGRPVAHTVVGSARDASGERTKTKSHEKVLDKQRGFSTKFNIPRWEEAGHFALTPGGAGYLLGAATDEKSFKIKVNDFAADYAVAKRKAGGTMPLLAGVTDTTFYAVRGAPTWPAAITHPAATKAGLKIVHWVMLDEVTAAGDCFVLEVWTWGTKYKAKVGKDVISSYIHSLVAAEGRGS